jgi:hypothetical protein
MANSQNLVSRKGERHGGRSKGTPNKMTRELKEAILQAAERAGEDGKGKGKLVGYLTRVAREDVKAFAGLLGKVLPLQISGEGGGAINIVISNDDANL